MLYTGWKITATIRELIAAIRKVDNHVTLMGNREPITPALPGEMRKDLTNEV